MADQRPHGRGRGIPVPQNPPEADPQAQAHAEEPLVPPPARAPAPVQLPPQPPQPIVRQHAQTASSAQHPEALARLPLYRLTFGLLDSTYQNQQLIVDINNQTTVFEATYQQLYQLTTLEPPITQDQFVRMCRTLLLKRVQDIYEKSTRTRAPNYVQIDRRIHVPAPIGDLLNVLGKYHSTRDGVIYVSTPPERPAAAPENWWAIDNDILARYCLFIGRMYNVYTMYEFPMPTDFDNRPICRTSINNHPDDYRSVRSCDSGTSPNDGFLRFLNDDLFAVNDLINYETASLLLVSQKHRPTVLRVYVQSYITGSNA